MIQLAPPTNQAAMILAAMIQYEGISERDTQFNGFRTRISELINHWELPIKKKMVEFTNQFGRKSKYSFHYLNEIDRLVAANVYEKVNKKVCVVEN